MTCKTAAARRRRGRPRATSRRPPSARRAPRRRAPAGRPTPPRRAASADRRARRLRSGREVGQRAPLPLADVDLAEARVQARPGSRAAPRSPARPPRSRIARRGAKPATTCASASASARPAPRAAGRPGPGGEPRRCGSTLRGGRGSGGQELAWRALMFSKVLVANRGEIAVRVIRALDELGIASVAVYSEADRDAQHVKRADEAYLLGPGPAAESYLNVDKLLEVDRALRRRGRAPRLRLPGRERRVRARARGRRDHVHRAAGVGDRRDGLEDAGARADAGRRRADRARHDRAGRDGRGRAARIAEDIGYPIAVKAAGGGGGKGFRVALEPDELAGGVRGRRARGREVLLRRDRLPRALPARPAPRRGAGAGRRARQRRPPRRARLLDPAPPPEADRGVPGAARRRRAARADRQDRRRRRARRRLPRRRHDRGPAARTASTSSWR